MTNPLTLELFGKRFTVKEFPTVGQLMEIDSLKSTLSKGQYHIMVKSNLKSTLFALSLIDAVATFSVLLGGEFHKHISNLIGEGKTVYDLPGGNAKELANAYDKVFMPWYKGFLGEIYAEESEELGNETESKGKGN